MQCKNCGIINDEDALYCKKCGNFLEEKKQKKKEKLRNQKSKVKKKVKTKTKIKKVKQKVRNRNKNNQENSFGKNVFIFFLLFLIIGLLGISLVMGYHIYDEEKNIEVPSLYHLSYEEAELILSKKNLGISKKEKKIESEEESNLIINQSKKEGTKVSKNTVIKVTIGKYDDSYIVENFIGKNIDEVKNNLNHKNILYQIVEEETQEEEENNVVLSQSPKKGKKINRSTTIKIIIGKYKEPSKETENEIDEDIEDTKSEENDS